MEEVLREVEKRKHCKDPFDEKYLSFTLKKFENTEEKFITTTPILLHEYNNNNREYRDNNSKQNNKENNDLQDEIYNASVNVNVRYEIIKEMVKKTMQEVDKLVNDEEELNKNNKSKKKSQLSKSTTFNSNNNNINPDDIPSYNKSLYNKYKQLIKGIVLQEDKEEENKENEIFEVNETSNISNNLLKDQSLESYQIDIIDNKEQSFYILNSFNRNNLSINLNEKIFNKEMNSDHHNSFNHLTKTTDNDLKKEECKLMFENFIDVLGLSEDRIEEYFALEGISIYEEIIQDEEEEYVMNNNNNDMSLVNQQQDNYVMDIGGLDDYSISNNLNTSISTVAVNGNNERNYQQEVTSHQSLTEENNKLTENNLVSTSTNNRLMELEEDFIENIQQLEMDKNKKISLKSLVEEEKKKQKVQFKYFRVINLDEELEPTQSKRKTNSKLKLKKDVKDNLLCSKKVKFNLDNNSNKENEKYTHCNGSLNYFLHSISNLNVTTEQQNNNYQSLFIKNLNLLEYSEKITFGTINELDLFNDNLNNYNSNNRNPIYEEGMNNDDIGGGLDSYLFDNNNPLQLTESFFPETTTIETESNSSIITNDNSSLIMKDNNSINDILEDNISLLKPKKKNLIDSIINNIQQRKTIPIVKISTMIQNNLQQSVTTLNELYKKIAINCKLKISKQRFFMALLHLTHHLNCKGIIKDDNNQHLMLTPILENSDIKIEYH
ncbi:hypothetical protein ABK040_013762 [Willaertia magna]